MFTLTYTFMGSTGRALPLFYTQFFHSQAIEHCNITSKLPHTTLMKTSR